MVIEIRKAIGKIFSDVALYKNHSGLDVLCRMVVMFICFASCTQSKPVSSESNYRNQNQWDGVIVRTGPEETDEERFNSFHRRSFEQRFLDEDYVLCTIESIEDTLSLLFMEENANIHYWDYMKKLNVCFLKLSVDILDVYRSKDHPMLPCFFGEQLYYEELSNKQSYGLMKHIRYFDSIVENKLYHKKDTLYLMVAEKEIGRLVSESRKGDKIFCNISDYYGDSKMIVSDIFYFSSVYKLNGFYSSREFQKYLHSIIKKQKKRIAKERQLRCDN